MEEVDALIDQARRAFSKRREEIGTTVELHLQPSAMRAQISQEMVITRQLLTLMASPGHSTSLRRTSIQNANSKVVESL